MTEHLEKLSGSVKEQQRAFTLVPLKMLFPFISLKHFSWPEPISLLALSH